MYNDVVIITTAQKSQIKVERYDNGVDISLGEQPHDVSILLTEKNAKILCEKLMKILELPIIVEIPEKPASEENGYPFK